MVGGGEITPAKVSYQRWSIKIERQVVKLVPFLFFNNNAPPPPPRSTPAPPVTHSSSYSASVRQWRGSGISQWGKTFSMHLMLGRGKKCLSPLHILDRHVNAAMPIRRLTYYFTNSNPPTPFPLTHTPRHTRLTTTSTENPPKYTCGSLW